MPSKVKKSSTLKLEKVDGNESVAFLVK